MKVNDFIKQLKLACSVKTIYATGGFGAWLGSDSQKKRYAKNYPANAKLIMDADNKTWVFDCIGLGKGILWGWNAEQTYPYGGAKYESNGVPDFAIGSMQKYCTEWHDTLKQEELVPGAWMRIINSSGQHAGFYIGNGKVIECTPAWKNGVQETKLSQQKWQSWGKVKWIDYSEDVDWEAKYKEEAKKLTEFKAQMTAINEEMANIIKKY